MKHCSVLHVIFMWVFLQEQCQTPKCQLVSLCIIYLSEAKRRFIFTISCSFVGAVGHLGGQPVQVACPTCHQTVVTKVEYSAGLLTYLSCAGLFFCGWVGRPCTCIYEAVQLLTSAPIFSRLVLGCCLIPFCVDRLRNAKHTCPTCKTELGVYKRL